MVDERERYSVGYAGGMLAGLGTRSAGRDAAFFVPHLRAGMSLLDCGCGPGSITLELAALLAPGEVVGIDLQGAQFPAAEADVGNVRFQVADVYALPFADASFDAVFAHGLLYHLRTPDAALAEMRRVLRPGGLIGIRDSDEAGSLYAPASPAIDRAIDLIARVWTRNGVDLHFGRKQRAALRRAGFEEIKASASYDFFGTPKATRGMGAVLADLIVAPQIAEPITSEGWATVAELTEMSAAFKTWSNDPDAFWARARCEAVARKPR